MRHEIHKGSLKLIKAQASAGPGQAKITSNSKNLMLDSIGIKHNTDKASIQRKMDEEQGDLSQFTIPGHSYLDKYESIFPPRDAKINFMEVGCCGSGWRNGAGIRTFLEYYTNPESLSWGIDIKKIVFNLQNIDERLKVIQTDCSKKGFTNGIPEEVAFDVIIEDGSHFWSHQKVAYKECIERLNPGGILVIEDIHTSFLSAERYADGEKNDFVTEAIGTCLRVLSKHQHELKANFPELEGPSATEIESVTLIGSAIIFKRKRDN